MEYSQVKIYQRPLGIWAPGDTLRHRRCSVATERIPGSSTHLPRSLQRVTDLLAQPQ